MMFEANGLTCEPIRWKPDLMDVVPDVKWGDWCEREEDIKKAVESRLVIGCGHLWRDLHK